MQKKAKYFPQNLFSHMLSTFDLIRVRLFTRGWLLLSSQKGGKGVGTLVNGGDDRGSHLLVNSREG